MLIDAASAYVFGHVLSRVVDEAPHEKDFEAPFRTQAEKNGISVKIVSLSDLEPIVGTLKELFALDFMGNTTQ